MGKRTAKYLDLADWSLLIDRKPQFDQYFYSNFDILLETTSPIVVLNC
jgi:hypothetical protein